VGAGSRETDYHGNRPQHLHGISFETHRGRIFHHPARTTRLLDRMPPTRLTLDLSHWHVACERVLGAHDAEERAWLHAEVVPHVDHIHARVGSTQAPQVPYGSEGDPEARAAHEAIWREVWRRKRARRAEEVTMTPELGPPPYQTVGGPEELWAQTLAEIEHLRGAFAAWEAAEPLEAQS